MLGFKKACGVICVPRTCQSDLDVRPHFPSTTRIVFFCIYTSIILINESVFITHFFLVSFSHYEEAKKIKTGDSE